MLPFEAVDISELCFRNGRVCTLIGTPPNLIISIRARETGVELGVFTTTLPGLFCPSGGNPLHDSPAQAVARTEITGKFV